MGQVYDLALTIRQERRGKTIRAHKHMGTGARRGRRKGGGGANLKLCFVGAMGLLCMHVLSGHKAYFLAGTCQLLQQHRPLGFPRVRSLFVVLTGVGIREEGRRRMQSRVKTHQPTSEGGGQGAGRERQGPEARAGGKPKHPLTDCQAACKSTKTTHAHRH